ncbi:hypothetical protein EYF80_034055 [Liparis tanakae]|uniref:Uncharacterized protein n=1 Tax=Liparis tanakae TaxID=230148 RepID=A0A4Z2GRL3_9TELE|nr:hypothetical protein EYF80_034055 [Liparis tanakae]
MALCLEAAQRKPLIDHSDRGAASALRAGSRGSGAGRLHLNHRAGLEQPDAPAERQSVSRACCSGCPPHDSRRAGRSSAGSGRSSGPSAAHSRAVGTPGNGIGSWLTRCRDRAPDRDLGERGAGRVACWRVTCGHVFWMLNN